MPRYTRPSERGSLSLSDLRTLLQELEVAKTQLSNRLTSFNPTLADLEDSNSIGQLQMQLVNVGAAAAELKSLSLQAIQAFDDLKAERNATMRAMWRRKN